MKKPKIMPIASTDWWVKPIGMLVHNWALIEATNSNEAVVYFFHDQGKAKGGGQSPNPFKTYNQSNGYIAVVDSIDFETVLLAKDGLLQNGFKRLALAPEPLQGLEPQGMIFDARKYEKGIYSSGEYWR